MKIVSTVFSLIVFGSLVGCKATTEGAKEDTRDNSINASVKLKDGIDNGANMASEAAKDAKNAGKNLSAATQLTPRIKNAINADSGLNSDGNVIDVDSTDTEVTLNGHVNSETMKALAGKIASEELVKAKAKQILVNKLSIEIPSPKK